MRTLYLGLALALAGNACVAANGMREARGPGVVPPDQLGQYWVLDAKSQKALPNRKGGKVPGCASATYMIDSEGNTMGIETVRSQPEGEYDGDLEKFLQRAHYDMAAGAEGDSVHTYLTLVWDGNDASQHAALEQACAVAGP